MLAKSSRKGSLNRTIVCLHPNESFQSLVCANKQRGKKIEFAIVIPRPSGTASRSNAPRYLFQLSMFFFCSTAARRHGAQRSFGGKIAEGGRCRGREVGFNEKNVVGIDGVKRH